MSESQVKPSASVAPVGVPLDDDEPVILDARRVRVVYQDLLARPPFEDERAHWIGRPFGELVDHLVGGLDFWDAWLEEQLYYFLLVDNFRPVSTRVLKIPADLTEGRIGVRDALHRIALCASFDRRNPGADTFVTVVMEQLLGVTVQDDKRQLEIGKRLYDGSQGTFLGEAGSSQSDVVRIAIEDDRTPAHLVAREAKRLLRDKPSKRALGRWAKRLRREPLVFAELVREWLHGEAYEARLARRHPISNRLFVRSLYVDLVGRLPQPDEAERMRNALDGLADPGPLRSVLARLLLDSGQVPLPERKDVSDEPQWVTRTFERLLGRAPDGEERAAFVRAMDDPACRLETVVYAIVSHPDYPTS